MNLAHAAKAFYVKSRKNWKISLIILSALLWVINCILFYPGYMSPDTIAQLGQAIGVNPPADWHPPVMMLIWKTLIYVTGAVSSMLLFQLLVFWIAMCLLALTLYTLTKSRKLSLVPLLLGLLPITFNISGVVWKDVQMAYALALAVVLLLSSHHLRLLNHKKLRWPMLTVIGGLIGYAALLRYNALVAVVPLVFLVVVEMNISKRRRINTLATVAFVGGILLTGALINRFFNVQKENPITSVMVDDIINIRRPEEIATNQGSVYRDLLSIQSICTNSSVVMNSYWHCADDLQRENIHIYNPQEVKAYWLRSVARKPFHYLIYKLETYTIFLFAPNQYIFQAGIDPNPYGQKVLSKKLQNISSTYVNSFGYQYFAYLFKAWFWLLLGILMVWGCLRGVFSVYRRYILALSLSSIIYTLSYIPVVVAVDYRYIYWSVIALLIAGLLAVAEKLPFKRKNI